MSNKNPLSITEPLTVKELAARLSVSETAIVKHLFFNMQVMRTVNGILDVPLARQVVADLGSDPDASTGQGVPRKPSPIVGGTSIASPLPEQDG